MFMRTTRHSVKLIHKGVGVCVCVCGGANVVGVVACGGVCGVWWGV
jgi:hypothetical protein